MVNSRLGSIDRRYQELLELAKLRKQRLLDALSLYQLYTGEKLVLLLMLDKLDFG